MPEDRRWSPHPLHRPGVLLVALLHLLVGLALLVDAVVFASALDRPLLGPIMAAGALFVASSGYLFFRKIASWRLRLVPMLALPVLFLVLHVVLMQVRDGAPHPGVAGGSVAVVAGLCGLAFAEWRRRSVRITLEMERLVVAVPRYRLEHELPLEAVREVTAARGLWGRLWGFGDFTARVRKGTMKDRVTKPVVGEAPREEALLGHGWDEEEHFHLKAAHPYRRVRRELENRILLARMAPKDREAAALADRLSADLGRLRA